ncbi:hypothetical protein [Sphingomonas quercus]|uniref:Uncharacterized protein n=1 Tax=Sphingomonas quercus TaxID=2842451 RepID=A0ABS6BP80_9SPHN|nr:hypothetical protein [Sphingomonas quercus]MBU3079462.1 hypothetical protein [Sphingomonas quercus]
MCKKHESRRTEVGGLRFISLEWRRSDQDRGNHKGLSRDGKRRQRSGFEQTHVTGSLIYRPVGPTARLCGAAQIGSRQIISNANNESAIADFATRFADGSARLTGEKGRK